MPKSKKPWWKIRKEAKRKREGGEGEEEGPAAKKPKWEDYRGEGFRENALYEKYYKAQKIVPEGEWDMFMASLRADLPVTFRLSNPHHAEVIKRRLKGEFAEFLKSESMEGFSPPYPLNWVPNELAWQVNASKSAIRKNEKVKKFHEFLVHETELGSISRQEAVSMVPVMFLDVQPHHKVLDMCAAPGSKTVQLLEALHSGDEENLPTGFVLANDVSSRRAFLLTHQTKRIRTPCFIITTHSAQHLPGIALPKGSILADPDDTSGQLKFNRVLCDVPCSGDATLRKAIDLWQRWIPEMGAALHKTQLEIALRGARLLAVGGLMVYSTCSFNPIENEAVVAQILKKCHGVMEIVDVSEQLPGLKRMPGLTTWKIMDRKGNYYDDAEAAQRAGHPSFKQGMFPPDPASFDVSQLTKCVRLLPHAQDTGGFFITVLRKVAQFTRAKDVKAEAELATEAGPAEAVPEEEEDDGEVGMPKGKEATYGARYDELEPLDGAGEMMKAMTSFYGFDADFPKNQFLTRSDKESKTYFISAAIKALLDADKDHRLKVVNTGLKVFDRAPTRDPEIKCEFRLCQEGLHIMQRWVNRQRLNVTPEDFKLYFGAMKPQRDAFCPATNAAIAALDRGPYMVVVRILESGRNAYVAAWNGKSTTNLLIADAERKVLYYQVLGEEMPEMKKKKAKAAKGSTKDGGEGPAPSEA